MATLKQLLLAFWVGYVLLWQHALCTNELPDTGRPLPVVKNIQDMFRWADHSLKFAAWATCESLDVTQSTALSRLQGFSMSTSFSGIGGPEHALESMIAQLGGSRSSVTHNYAIEVFQESRRELVLLPNVPSCIFDDINRFWNPELDVNELWRIADFNTAIPQGGSVILDGGCGYCTLHDSWLCKLMASSLHVGGTPCPDWSTQGLREQECGDDLMATMAFVAMRHTLEDEMFLNENVAGFLPELIFACLAAKYLITSCVAMLESYWPQRRHRRLTFGLLKSKVVMRVQWSPFSSKYRRKIQCGWAALFIASPAEIKAELNWSRKRTNSLFEMSDADLHELAKTDKECQADPELLPRLLTLKHRTPHTESLTWWELKNIDGYIIQYGEDSPYEVSQDSFEWPMHGTPTILPCIIAGMQMLFSCNHWRWMTPSEVLMAQGYSLSKVTKVNKERTCWDTPRKLWLRRRNVQFQQAGDTMNLSMIGHALTFALVGTKRVLEPETTEAICGPDPAVPPAKHRRLSSKQPVDAQGLAVRSGTESGSARSRTPRTSPPSMSGSHCESQCEPQCEPQSQLSQPSQPAIPAAPAVPKAAKAASASSCALSFFALASQSSQASQSVPPVPPQSAAASPRPKCSPSKRACLPDAQRPKSVSSVSLLEQLQSSPSSFFALAMGLPPKK